MKSTQSRREFVKQTTLLTALTALAGTSFASSKTSSAPAGKPFKLNYAPHDGMFKNHAGADFIDQIKFMADQGFRGIEDNG
ncbi:MAG TPA: twin-arginine translocation signal domain-containing protein, partial [Cyclobacteriaceae bacterium]|nr:twin-arginine translocation signal domain-containing protein [Cyclobacteriaceae bacterium]